jgi:hypothetical protein
MNNTFYGIVGLGLLLVAAIATMYTINKIYGQIDNRSLLENGYDMKHLQGQVLRVSSIIIFSEKLIPK